MSISVAPALPNVTWKGVPLPTISYSISGQSKQWAQHQYFGATFPYLEDTGGQITVITVECYLAGAALMAESMIISQMIRAGGFGLLVMPTELPRTVALARDNKTLRLDGTIEMSLEFVVVDPNQGNKLFPMSILNSVSDLVSSAYDAVDSFAGDFISDIGNLFSLSSFAVSGILSGASLVTTGLGGLIGGANLVSGFTKGTEFLSDGSWTVVPLDRSSLTSQPEILSSVSNGQSKRSTILSAQSLLLSNATTNKAACDNLAPAVTASASQASTSTAGELRDSISDYVTAWSAAILEPADNITASAQAITALSNVNSASEAVAAFTRRLLIANIASQQSSLAITSKTQADALQSQITSLIDNEIDTAMDSGSRDTVNSLRDLRTKVVKDLQTRGGVLPDIMTATFNVNLPSFVLAQKIYGDATRADELLARNPTDNPLFMPTSIECLNK